MKKLWQRFLLVFILITVGPVFVQSQGWQIGYLIQPQYSTISRGNAPIDIKIEQNQTFTIYTGLTATYFFSSNIGLGTGVSYGHDSQKFIYQKTSNLVTERSAHHYVFNMLKMPINFSFLKKIGKVSLLVEGGPQFCFVTKVKDKTRSGTLDYTENYATFQIGFHIGTGVGIQLTEQFMLFIKPNLEITNYSFNHTVENINQNPPLGKNLSGSSFGLQLGIMWMKGKTATGAK